MNSVDTGTKMAWDCIQKQPETWKTLPNLLDYEVARADFSWDAIRAELQGLPKGRGLNIAHEAVDRHGGGRLRGRVALKWRGGEGASRDFTYGDLKEQSNRFANILRGFGIGKGDTVSTLAGRIPELYIAALGVLKNTSVFCPLFAAFGPEPICQLLSRGDAKILLTTERFYQQKVHQLMGRLPIIQRHRGATFRAYLDRKTPCTRRSFFPGGFLL